MHDQHSNLRALCFDLRRQMEDTLNPAAPKCNAQLQALQDLIERTENNDAITNALLSVSTPRRKPRTTATFAPIRKSPTTFTAYCSTIPTSPRWKATLRGSCAGWTTTSPSPKAE